MRPQGRNTFHKQNANSVGIRKETLFSVTNGENLKEDWLLDSGASQHMSNNRNLFDKIVPVYNFTICLADGRVIKPSGKGNVTLIVKCNDGRKLLQVPNVLHAKELDKNLLSISRLAEEGAQVSFSKYGASVTRKGIDIIQAIKTGGLYKVKLCEKGYESANVSELNIATTIFKSDEIGLWHRRFGHISEEALRRTIPIKGNLQSCPECLSSNFSRKPFQPVLAREKEILERVYSDICGPFSTKTAGGASYFAVFIDGHSKMAKAYLLKQKSELMAKFMEYKANAERQSGMRLKTIRCDNGGEYSSNRLKNYCSTQGITIEYTSPIYQSTEWSK